MAATQGEWLDQQLKDLNLSFDAADTDKNGSLSKDEVFNILKGAGYRGSPSDMASIFLVLDKNDDGKISKEEFNKGIHNLPVGSKREMALAKAFKDMDKDGSGSLSRQEIRNALYAAKTDLTTDQIKDVFKYATKDADKEIQYDEFLKILNFSQSESTVRKVFDQLDTDKSGAVSLDEILKAVSTEGELSHVMDQIGQVFREISNDPSAKDITFNKFCEAWMKKAGC